MKNRRVFIKKSATLTLGGAVFAGLINTPGNVRADGTTDPGTTQPGTTATEKLVPDKVAFLAEAPALTLTNQGFRTTAELEALRAQTQQNQQAPATQTINDNTIPTWNKPGWDNESPLHHTTVPQSATATVEQGHPKLITKLSLVNVGPPATYKVEFE